MDKLDVWFNEWAGTRAGMALPLKYIYRRFQCVDSTSQLSAVRGVVLCIRDRSTLPLLAENLQSVC